MWEAPAKITIAVKAPRSSELRPSRCQARRCSASTAGAAQASGITLETERATPLVALIAAIAPTRSQGDDLDTKTLDTKTLGAKTLSARSTTKVVTNACNKT